MVGWFRSVGSTSPTYLPTCAAALLLQLQVEAVADAPKTLTLDTRDLTLHKVTLLSGSPAAVAAAAGAVVEEAGAHAAEQSLQYALADKHPVSKKHTALLPVPSRSRAASLAQLR
jgi:hypothetical protein